MGTGSHSTVVSWNARVKWDVLVVCLVEMVKSAPTAFGFFLISSPPFAALADLSTFNQGGQSLSNIIMMGIGRHPHTTCGTLLVSNAAMMSGFFLFISTTYLPTFNLGGSSKNIIMMDTILILFFSSLNTLWVRFSIASSTIWDLGRPLSFQQRKS